MINVRFTNGTFARVRVLDLEGDRVELREIVLDGGMNVRHRLGEFEPASAFRIEVAALNPASFEAHSALALRAAEWGLPDRAVEQAGAALLYVGADAISVQRARDLRNWLAGSLESWLREAIDQGDLARASHFLKLIATRHSDLRSEDELEALARAVDALERDQAASRRAARQAKLDEKTRKEIERRLKPILEEVKRADELYMDAIRSSAKMTRSSRLAEESIDSYRDAWKAAAALQERYPEDEALVIEIESIANHLHDHTVFAALHASNLLAVRSDFIGALEWVHRILAIDPLHPEALEMKRTIMVAQSAAGAWWGWGQAPVGR